MPANLDENFWKRETGHRSVGAPVELMWQEQAAITDQDAQTPRVRLGSFIADPRQFVQARMILMLEHDEISMPVGKGADGADRHVHAVDRRKILETDGDVRAERGK